MSKCNAGRLAFCELHHSTTTMITTTITTTCCHTNNLYTYHFLFFCREWARSIHGLWALLVRENVADVAVHPQRHSLLARRHPVVVPGGRFRESYYWDTFWTIRYVHTYMLYIFTYIHTVHVYPTYYLRSGTSGFR